MRKPITALWFAAAIALTACVGPVSENDRPCPCATGWTCCVDKNVCIGAGVSCPVDDDAGRATTSEDSGDATASDGTSPEASDEATEGAPATVPCGTATTPGGPTLLAMLQSGAELAVDSTDLYVAPWPGLTATAMTRVSLSDCSTTPLNPVAEGRLAIDATNAYSFTSNALVIACAKTGCDGTYMKIASQEMAVADIASDGSNVYLSTWGAGSVQKIPIDGGPVSILVPTGLTAGELVVVGGLVIYGGRDVSGSAVLGSVPTTGGSPSVLFGASVDDPAIVDSARDVSAVTADATNAYFGTDDGILRQIPLVGGPMTTLATNGVEALAVDGSNVYWSTDGSIYRTPIGGGPITLLVTNLEVGDDDIPGVAIDNANVYFTTLAGGVFMLPKDASPISIVDAGVPNASAPDAPDGEDAGDEASSETATIASFCAAAVAADCGTTTLSLQLECTTHLEDVASCAMLQTCLACAGPSPVVTCSDAGSTQVPGCACDIDDCPAPSYDAGGGASNYACAGAQNVVQTSTSNVDASSAQLVTYSAGSPLVLWGPTLDAGGAGELSGTFEVTGLPPNGGFEVRVVTSGCATTGCPDDLVFNVGAPEAGSPVAVLSFVPWAGCGVWAVGANGDGELVVSVSKTGDGGAGQGVGLAFTQLPSFAEL